MAPSSLVLFGGAAASWKADDWVASDDRVRGGSSQSYLDIVPAHSPQLVLDSKPRRARFYGTLDTKTLGGAGFASQRTRTTDTTWDLSDYDGIELRFSSTSAKRYTFILKDALLDPDPGTGRERATLSWEYDFVISAAQSHYLPSHASCTSAIASDGCCDCRCCQGHKAPDQHGDEDGAEIDYSLPSMSGHVEESARAHHHAVRVDPHAPDSSKARLGPESQPNNSDTSCLSCCSTLTVLRIPWSQLRPTYRGREKRHMDPIDTASIKRFSIMMRSFFDEQSGDFEIYLDSIAAYKGSRPSYSITSSLLRCLGRRF